MSLKFTWQTSCEVVHLLDEAHPRILELISVRMVGQASYYDIEIIEKLIPRPSSTICAAMSLTGLAQAFELAFELLELFASFFFAALPELGASNHPIQGRVALACLQ